MNVICGERESGTVGWSIYNSDSLAGQNFVLNGQKYDKIWCNDSWHTAWTKYDARWSEVQHLARRRSTHYLDEMWCEMVSKHNARWQSTHKLDKMWCKMVRNSTTPCRTMVNSLPGRNVMQDGQKCNNTFNARWQSTHLLNKMWCQMVREIQQHLMRQQLTHCLDKMWCEMVSKHIAR